MKRYFLNIIKAVFNLETESIYDDQRKTMLKEKTYMVSHLRAMIHNLPFHLNLDSNEEYYLSEVFDRLDNLFDNRGRIYISIELWEYLENKYIGTHAGHSTCDIVTKEDFENARNTEERMHPTGDPVALLKIAKTILFNNIEKYQKKNIWYKKMPENKDL